MRIVVCIKQVPSSNEVKMDPVTKTIIRDGKQSVINPYDSFAVEETIRIKKKTGAETIALSMGIPSAEEIIRDSIARGIDRGMLLSDRNFAGSDTLATSYTLSLGIRELGKVDMILCGKLAIDGDTAQIGPELAEHLQIPHITDVDEFLEIHEDKVICKKSDEKHSTVLEVRLPALFTLNKDINNPRLPSISGVLDSLNKKVDICDSQKLKAEASMLGTAGSPTQVVRTFIPQSSKNTVMIEGKLEHKVSRIIEIIREES